MIAVEDLTYLLTDPRASDFTEDSHLWAKMFKLIPTMPDKQVAMALSLHLWHIRAWGTVIRYDGSRYELSPLIDPI